MQNEDITVICMTCCFSSPNNRPLLMDFSHLMYRKVLTIRLVEVENAMEEKQLVDVTLEAAL